MDLVLKGRSALVTGASRGIGAAIARALAEEGVDVGLVARDAAKLEELAADLRGRHAVRALPVAADLSRPETPAQAVEAVAAGLGGLDILVNCAGATRRGDVLELSDGDWIDGFALKFFGYVRVTRAAWPHLTAKGGVVINIVGVAARTPSADHAIAGAVNAALLSFGKAMADKGRRDGVRVNSVNPGYVRTDRLAQRLHDIAARTGCDPEEAGRAVLREIDVRRFAEPDEIARLVAFLASDAAGYVEGTAIDIDGGWTRGI